MALVSAFMKMLALIGGIDNKVTAEILEEYREELYQFKYNYKYETYATKVSIDRVRKYLETDRMMQRVDDMTVEDDDIRQVKDE
jgi:hypothetical protein